MKEPLPMVAVFVFKSSPVVSSAGIIIPKKIGRRERHAIKSRPFAFLYFYEMKKLIIVLMAISFGACENNLKENPGSPEENEKQEIFPVASFIQNQVHLVDSLQLPVLKYTTSNLKTDTALISTNDFKILAEAFMEPDITSQSLRKYYNESSFADQSIPSVTLTYSTANRDLEVQRIDVIIHPDPVFTDKVSTIYIEKVSNHHDTLIVKKLFWKANKNFQVITSVQPGTRAASVNLMKVVWDSMD